MRTLSQIKRDYINASIFTDPVERKKWATKYNDEFVKAMADGAPWDEEYVSPYKQEINWNIN